MRTSHGEAAVPCGWEDNGIAPRPCTSESVVGYVHLYGLSGRRKGDEHPAYTLSEYGIPYLTLLWALMDRLL